MSAQSLLSKILGSLGVVSLVRGTQKRPDSKFNYHELQGQNSIRTERLNALDLEKCFVYLFYLPGKGGQLNGE